MGVFGGFCNGGLFPVVPWLSLGQNLFPVRINLQSVNQVCRSLDDVGYWSLYDQDNTKV